MDTTFCAAVEAARTKVIFSRFLSADTALIRFEIIGGQRAAIRVRKIAEDLVVDHRDFDRAHRVAAEFSAPISYVYSLFVRAVDVARAAFSVAISTAISAASAMNNQAAEPNAEKTLKSGRSLNISVAPIPGQPRADVFVSTFSVAGLHRSVRLTFGVSTSPVVTAIQTAKICTALGLHKQDAQAVLRSASAAARSAIHGQHGAEKLVLSDSPSLLSVAA